jgi:hypothetical protein
MVGSDMTPSLPFEQSLSGAVYFGSSASSWSKLGFVARDSMRTLGNDAHLSINSKLVSYFSELPIISYNFSTIKIIYETFLKSF